LEGPDEGSAQNLPHDFAEKINVANQTNNLLVMEHSSGAPSGITRTLGSSDDVVLSNYNSWTFSNNVVDFDAGLTLAASQSIVGDGALTLSGTSGDLTLSSVTSGDVIIDPAGDAIVKLAGTSSSDFFEVEDSADATVLKIAGDGTGQMGKSGATITISGNLTVSENFTVDGTTTTVNSTTLVVDDNLIVANSGPGASRDAGYMIQRWQDEVNDGTGDLSSDTAAETGTAQAGAASTITLAAGANASDDYYNGWYIKITNDTPTGIQNEIRKITDYVGATKIATVNTAWDAGSPTSSTTYALLDRPYMGVFYDESADEWVFGATASDPGAAAVTITDNVAVHVGGLTADDASTFAAAVTFSGGEKLISGGNLQLNDSITLSLGSDDDLSVMHNGGNAAFINTTGHMAFDNQVADKQIRFNLGSDDANSSFRVRSDDNTVVFQVDGGGAGAFSGSLDVDGASTFDQVTIDTSDGTFTVNGSGAMDVDVSSDFGAGLINSAGELLVSGGNVQLNDNIVLSLGSDDDLALKHTGSAGSMVNLTGDLTVDQQATTSSIILMLGDDAAGSSVQFQNNSAVALFKVDGDGDVAVSIAGQTTTVASALVVDENITLGSNASDTLTINADLASNLIPDADGTRDLGEAANAFRGLYLGEDANSGAYFGLDSNWRLWYDEGTADTFYIDGAASSPNTAGTALVLQGSHGGAGGGGSSAGLGGNVTLYSGDGGAGASGGANNPSAGGAMAFQSGSGGAGVASTHNGAAGGSLSITGGTGGAGAASQTSGAGGALTIQGGDAGAANGGTQGNGANLVLDGGAGATNGAVNVGPTNAASVGIGRSGITATVAGALTVTEASQFNSTVTVGVDDTGYDVIFYGATASAYMQWDESADNLILNGAAGFTFGTGVVIDDILDEDNMASDSATALATQQSIKAYVDSAVSGSDLDFAGDSGTGAVDLDSQTFTVDTGNGLTTAAASQTLTVSLDASNSVQTTWTGSSHSVTTAGGIDLVSTEDAASSIYLHANGGTSESITLHSDQGTGAASIALLSDVGGIDVDATAGPIDVLAGTTLSAKGAGGASFGDDVGTWEFDGAGAVSETGMTSLSATPSGAITLTAGGASTWSTTSGALTLTSAAAATWSTSAGALSLDGAGGVNIAGNAGEVDVTTSGAVDINSGAGTWDASTLSLDSTDSTNLTMTANDGSAKVLTIAATNGGAGEAQMSISATDQLDIGDGTATLTFDAGAISEAGATSFSMTPSGAITLTAGAASVWSVSSGALDIDSAGALSLNSSAGVINVGNDAVNQNINVGTTGTRQISVGSASATVHLTSGGGAMAVDSTGGASTWTVVDNTADSLKVAASGQDLMSFHSTNSAELVESVAYLEWAAGAGVRLSSGAAVTASYAVYIDTTGRVQHCDPNSDASARFFGVSLDAAAGAGEADKRVVSEGLVTMEFDGTAIVDGDRGKPVYLSASTVGKVSIDVPSGSGDTIFRVGYLQTRNSDTQGVVALDKRFVGKIA